jgi:ATP-binding cassette subfamily A (ABC1) protein 3
VYWNLLFPTSSAAVSLFWYILNGWALTSASVFAAAFFSKSQLSGIYVVVGFLVVALGAMIMDAQNSPGSGVVAALSLLFPSMNFIFTLGYYCRFEMQGLPVNLVEAPPSGPPIPIASSIPAVVPWVFLVIQIFAYPVLAIAVELIYHGISFSHRESDTGPAATDSSVALETSGLGKTYAVPWYKRWFGDRSSAIVALEELDLLSQKRQILCLLGANGSGKTTTLDLIAGKQSLTHGSVRINSEWSQLGTLITLVARGLRCCLDWILILPQEFAHSRTCCLMNLPWLSMFNYGARSKTVVKIRPRSRA